MKATTRILVVDDNPVAAEFFGEILQRKGYEVFMASTGQEALRLTRELRPDVLLLDVGLPDLRGTAVCARIKSDPGLSSVYVVLVSAEPANVLGEPEVPAEGADDFIVKPMGSEEFLARIRTIVRLREANASLRLMAKAVQSTREMICITDRDNRFTFVNEAFLRGYGYTLAELLGRTPDLLYAADNPPGLCDQVFKGTLDHSWHGEIRNLRKDGSTFPISLSTSQIKGEDGQIVGLVGVARDLTSQRQAERQTRAFGQLGYRLSAAATPRQAAEIILDAAASLFGWDAGYVDLYATAQDKIIPVLTIDTVAGKQEHFEPESFTPSPLARRIMQEGGRLVHGGEEPELEAAMRPFGNVQRPSACMMFVPVRSNRRALGVLSIQSYRAGAYSATDLQVFQALADYCGDALSRIRGAEALEESQRLLKVILDTIPDPAWMKDVEGRYLACNEAFAKFCQTTPGALLGKTSAEAGLPDAARAVPEDRKVLESGEPMIVESPRTDARGKVHWFELCKSPTFGPNGEVTGTVGIGREITERKLLAEELHRLPRRIIEAQEAERMRVARELHDGVNQLLAAAQMRIIDVQESLARSRPAAREILARSRHLLVQAVEENRRIAHNLRPDELDQLGLTMACHNLCRELKTRTDLSVSCHITRLGGRLSPAVELNLFRILQEALANVEKHAKATKVRAGIAALGDTLTLKIEDDGRGFDLERVGKRGRKTLRVGLTSMRERAAAMEGTCEIISAPGKGTTVKVTIPWKKG